VRVADRPGKKAAIPFKENMMIVTKTEKIRLKAEGGKNLTNALLAAVLCLAGLPGALFGSPAPAPSDLPSLDLAAKGRIIDWICRELSEFYVFPDVAVRAEAFLREKFKAGTYDAVSPITVFAEALTKDLVEITRDKHMFVRYARRPSLDEEAMDEAEERRRRNLQLLNWRIENFKFKKLEHLDGNVGVLRFDGFADVRDAGDTAVAAMNFLGNCEALIIDLRNNNGGYGNLGQFILGYFFEKEQHLNDFYTRRDDETRQVWTSVHVSGPRLNNTALYILTSRRTASAAEAFTFNLKSLNRAVAVGEKTSGAAHIANRIFNKELNLELTVSVGRPIVPAPGASWEAVGIAPDVECPASDALDKAYELALKDLHDRTDPKEETKKTWLKVLWEYQAAVTRPRPIDPSALKAYEGSFGPARIVFEDGWLYAAMPNGDKNRLFSSGPDTFVIEGNKEMRILFERGTSGEVTAVYTQSLNGEKSPRIPKAEKRPAGMNNPVC